MGSPFLGTAPAGNTTTTTQYGPWAPQQPYLQQLFGGANSIFQNQFANPGSTVAGFTPMQQSAFGQINQGAGGAGGMIAGANGTGNNYLNSLLGGNYLNNNPAMGGLTSIMNGTNPVSQDLLGIANGTNGAAGALSGMTSGVNQNNPGMAGLNAFASGSMMNNPYMQQTAGAMTDPIVRAFQTATMPSINSQMEAAGRYGSGALANATGQAQDNLTTQLGNALAPLYSNMYQTNQGNMLQGANAASGAYLGGLGTQAGAASNLLGAETGAAGTRLNSALGGASALGSNYTTGTGQMLGGFGMTPSFTNSLWNGIGAQGSGGAQQQQLAQLGINAPWQILNNYGGAVGGSYGSNGSQSTPYFSNGAASGLGLLTGLGTLASMPTGLGTLASMPTGNGSTLGSTLWNGLTSW